MNYYFRPMAIRGLKKLPQEVQKRILNKIDFYFKSPHPLKFAESLKDKELGDFRFRVGDYRVILDVDFKQNLAIILVVGHRKDVYKSM